MKTNIPIMVNGKVKASIPVPIDVSKTQIFMEATKIKAVSNAVDGKELVTDVYVPNRMYNIVVK